MFWVRSGHWAVKALQSVDLDETLVVLGSAKCQNDVLSGW